MFRLGHGVVGVLPGRVGIMEGRPNGGKSVRNAKPERLA
jgi:hypothetical protein